MKKFIAAIITSIAIITTSYAQSEIDKSYQYFEKGFVETDTSESVVVEGGEYTFRFHFDYDMQEIVISQPDGSEVTYQIMREVRRDEEIVILKVMTHEDMEMYLMTDLSYSYIFIDNDDIYLLFVNK